MSDVALPGSLFLHRPPHLLACPLHFAAPRPTHRNRSDALRVRSEALALEQEFRQAPEEAEAAADVQRRKQKQERKVEWKLPSGSSQVPVFEADEAVQVSERLLAALEVFEARKAEFLQFRE